MVGGPADQIGGRIERFLRSAALAQLTKETRALAQHAGLPLTNVSVRDPQARWGSCTGKGRIAYSWRLILAPPDVRSSVVAHEVAHLRHLDHSAAFWGFATELYGCDMAAARLWLRKHGASLHWIGRSANS